MKTNRTCLSQSGVWAADMVWILQSSLSWVNTLSLNYMGTLQRALIYFKNIIAISGCAEVILFYASFAVVNRPHTRLIIKTFLADTELNSRCSAKALAHQTEHSFENARWFLFFSPSAYHTWRKKIPKPQTGFLRKLMFLPVSLEGDSFKVVLVSFKAPVMGQRSKNKPSTLMSPSIC